MLENSIVSDEHAYIYFPFCTAFYVENLVNRSDINLSDNQNNNNYTR